MLVEGRKLVLQAIEHARPNDKGRLQVVLNKEENDEDHLLDEILENYPSARVFEANSRVKGALVSALIACQDLDLEMPLLIAAGDSFLVHHVSHYFPKDIRNLGAWTTAFRSSNPRWSFLSTSDEGLVTEVAEKEVIGPFATTGIFLFGCGLDFVKAAEWVLVNNAMTSGRYFVSTALNYFISRGSIVGFNEIARSDYFSFSAPADFLRQAN